MRSIAVLLLTCLLLAGRLHAQSYKVTTDQPDSFSVALVKLLNCAAERFKDCTGDSIRSTGLMGDDHKLTIPFPGSAMAVVRSRDWDKNAYIEFRGFSGKEDRDRGIRNLVAKIKTALGQQLYDPNENKKDKEIYFYGLSIKDDNGYFSMNMELFGGSSSAPIYLLGPEWEDDIQPKKDFVLLKIYSGIPAYYYYIHDTAPPDTILNTTLRQLMLDAQTDFDRIRIKKTDGLLKKRRGVDTLHLNGFEVLMNYRGGSYSANLMFAAAIDSVTFNKQWLYYQQSLQAAIGSEYVYYLYATQQAPAVLYYSPGLDGNKPRIYLDLQMQGNNPFIQIKIPSCITHPAKRSMDPDEY